MDQDQKNIIDLVIEKKQFPFYKVISRGKYSATIEVTDKDKGKKSAVLVMTKKESESRLFDFDKIQNPYTVKALQHEYICKLQTYLIYTETGQYTLADKVNDKSFRKTTEAIECILDWIKDISLGIKKLHTDGYIHLNLKASCIVIDSNNRAKIGGFDFTRHTSAQNANFESGVESCYTPPETFANNTRATVGMKFDIWCLAMMIVEALTKNYIAQKSTKITSWPEEYPVLHKVLQAKKFRKLVKVTYPKAAKAENLEKILQLIRHTLKFNPAERPSSSVFFMLLMELRFLKDIDKQMTEEKIWQEKVTLQEIENKMQYLALEKKSSAPLKYEKREIDPNDAVMGDVISDERRKENREFPFEHRDIHQSKFFSSYLETSQPHKVQTLQPKPCKEDDAMNHLTEDHSEMFITDPESKKLNVTEEREDVNTSETEECFSKNNEEKASKGTFTVKGFFQKMVIWTLDEKLYTGVIQDGSYINRLSKVLTG